MTTAATEKEKMSSELGMLKELFPTWSKEDLLAVLFETDNDVECAIARISEGFAKPFSPVAKAGKKSAPVSSFLHASDPKEKAKASSDRKKATSSRRSKNSVAPSEKQPLFAAAAASKPAKNSVSQPPAESENIPAQETLSATQDSALAVTSKPTCAETAPLTLMKPIWSKIIGNSLAEKQKPVPSEPAAVESKTAAAPSITLFDSKIAVAESLAVAASSSCASPCATEAAACESADPKAVASVGVVSALALVPPPPGGLLPQTHAAEMYAFATETAAAACKPNILSKKPETAALTNGAIDAATGSKCFSPYDVSSSGIPAPAASLPHRSYINAQISTDAPCALDATTPVPAATFMHNPFSIGFSSGNNTAASSIDASAPSHFSLPIPAHHLHVGHSNASAGVNGAPPMSHHPHYGYPFAPSFYNPYLYAAPTAPPALHNGSNSSGAYGAALYGGGGPASSLSSSIGVASNNQSYKGSFYPTHGSHFHSHSKMMNAGAAPMPSSTNGTNNSLANGANAYGMMGGGNSLMGNGSHSSANSHLFLDHAMNTGQFQNTFPSYYGHHPMMGAGHSPSNAYSSHIPQQQQHVYGGHAPSQNAAMLPSAHYLAASSAAACGPPANSSSAVSGNARSIAPFSGNIAASSNGNAAVSANSDKLPASDRPHSQRHVTGTHNQHSNAAFNVRNYWGANGSN